MKLPSNNIWRQVNQGDKFGDLWSSFNLDLTSKLGTLKISPRLLLNISTTDDAQLGAPPCAFKTFITTDTYIWAIAKAHMWHSAAAGSAGGPNDPFIQDATGGTPTALNSNQSDMEVFQSTLCVSGASTSMFLLSSSGTWSTLSNAFANSSGLHALTYFRAQNKLYGVDDNAAGISSLNKDLSTIVLSTSGAQYSLNDLVEGSGINVGSHISCIDSNSFRIWIGTSNNSDSYCRIYAWDGSQASGPNESYFVDASGILAIEIIDDVPVAFDTKGRLLQFNGGTFKEIDRLPFEHEPLKILQLASLNMVHYNGMTIIDGKLNILLNTSLLDTNSTNKENIPSGIWEYTKETGLYHKASVGQTKSGGTIADYGQQKLSLVGAISEIEISSSDITQGSINGRYLVGCDYYTNATSTLSGIFYDDTNDTLQKYGYFVTKKIFSDNIQDTWQKIYLRIKKLLAATDQITVKYRTEDEAPLEGTITWVNTSSFTTAMAISGYAVGDEVEILQGTGSGKSAHIVTIQAADASSYIVTLDDIFTGVTTGTAKARFQTWKKAGSFTDQNSDIASVLLGVSSSWIQLKVCMQFTGKDEINDLILENVKHK